jgi:hypothetical protein
MSHALRGQYPERRASKKELGKVYLLDCLVVDPSHSTRSGKNANKEVTGWAFSIPLRRKLIKGHGWTNENARLYRRSSLVDRHAMDVVLQCERL